MDNYLRGYKTVLLFLMINFVMFSYEINLIIKKKSLRKYLNFFFINIYTIVFLPSLPKVGGSLIWVGCYLIINLIEPFLTCFFFFLNNYS